MLQSLRRVGLSLNLTVPDQIVFGRRYMSNLKSVLTSRLTEKKTLDDFKEGCYPSPQLQSHSIITTSNSSKPVFSLETLHSHIQPFAQFSVRHYSDCIDDGSSNKQDPCTGLTPKMVKLLKCISVVVKPDAQTHGKNIFKRMFQMDINIQRMFPKFACDDMCALDRNPAFLKHAESVMMSILNLMDNSGSVPDLKSSLAVLIKIHKELCIPPKHFITFGNAINDYLKETLGIKYSEDVECAVAFFWKYVVIEMTAQPIKMKCTKCGCTILKQC